MSSIRISGDTSGYYDLSVPAVAGTNTIELNRVIIKIEQPKIYNLEEIINN